MRCINSVLMNYAALKFKKEKKFEWKFSHKLFWKNLGMIFSIRLPFNISWNYKIVFSKMFKRLNYICKILKSKKYSTITKALKYPIVKQVVNLKIIKFKYFGNSYIVQNFLMRRKIFKRQKNDYKLNLSLKLVGRMVFGLRIIGEWKNIFLRLE